ncbi:MAG TPA: hypothetical protein H9663_06525 [Firmicutes bacterium]|nr:hypothetical protein [Bacillota bacterium]
MTRLAIMDATETRRSERRDESRAISTEEREHSDHISENYRRLLFDNAESWSSAAESAVPTLERQSIRTEAYAPVRETAPVHESVREETAEISPSNTAQRLADYVAYPAGSKKVLFEGLAYKNGELIDTRAPAQAPKAEAVVAPAAPAFVPAPAAAPAPAVAPVQAPAEEDALPTRRTLDTLRRSDSAAEEQTRTNALAALSLKTKLVLCAIAAAIILAIVIVCINTGLLSAVNADILAKNARLEELTQNYTQIQEDLDAIRDPSNIDEWAQENGMVRPAE